jgi:hypothetical protein
LLCYNKSSAEITDWEPPRMTSLATAPKTLLASGMPVRVLGAIVAAAALWAAVALAL